jgi:hypothetical protein
MAMTAEPGDDTRYERVRFVERDLGRGRRFVQALDAQAPTQMAGSAPMIWDLLDAHVSVNEVAAMLQQRFSDSPEVIANGVRMAIESFLDASLIVEQP